MRLIVYLILLFFAINLYSQTFEFQGNNQFGLVTAGIYNLTPTFVDIDNDGDFDLFVGDYNQRIFYFENIGTRLNPFFSSKQQNPFGLITTGIYNLAPIFVDIDNDGDFDLFVGDYNQRIFYFENIGTRSNPVFTSKQQNPFGLITTGIYYLTPTFIDINNDGDYDLFVGDPSQRIFYFENTGTRTNPVFSAGQLSPFGLNTAGIYYLTPTFVDINNDGDYDLFVGDASERIFYFENTGTITNPIFSAGQLCPFGIITSGLYYLAPCFVDIDNDADFDLFIGDANQKIAYYRNLYNSGINTLEKQENIIFPNPSSGNIFVMISEIANLEILNMEGKTIETFNNVNKETIINIDYLTCGVYIIKVITEKGIIITKFIKQ
jgi:hypothetical protein